MTAMQEIDFRSLGTMILKTHPGRDIHQPLIMKPCAKQLKTMPVQALGIVNPEWSFLKHHSSAFAQAGNQQQTVSILSSWPHITASAKTCRWLSPTTGKPTWQKGFSAVSSMEMKSRSSWGTPTLVSNHYSQTRWQRRLLNVVGFSDALHLVKLW